MTNPVVIADLVRTEGGRVVHRADCHYITRSGDTSRAIAWEWAKGRKVKEVSDAMVMVSARACRGCRPIITADVR